MKLPSNGMRARSAKRGQIAYAAVPTVPSKPKTLRKDVSVSVLVSFGLHTLLLVLLSWIYFELPRPKLLDSILTLTVSDKDSAVVSLDVESEPAETLAEPTDIGETLVELSLSEAGLPDPAMMPDLDPVSRVEQVETPAIPPVHRTTSKRTVPGKSTSSKRGNAHAVADAGANVDHFTGRSPKSRLALVRQMGGTDASEAAVARGLVWLKNHQRFDGSWNFFHAHYPACDCSMPGQMDNNPNAATAMALLAFLGAGQTHEEGEYQTEVLKGLDFLLQNGTEAEKGICFYGTLTGTGTFYTHGLVTIALSEALAMSGDARLRPAVVGAIDFLVATQEQGGGWRYFPGQPGDTSVVAWQLMALKSAQFSRVPVPQRVFTGIDRFMGSVSSMRGSQYAYTPQRRDSPSLSMTAAGLLSRMYLEWQDNGRMKAGIRVLDEHGPDYNDMYYNYYATQVMHHWGGPEWERWNLIMREHLIRTQILTGHATGSWDVADLHGRAGGRLYMTTLALLTLEVYYRHVALYQKDRIEVPLIDPVAPAKTP